MSSLFVSKVAIPIYEFESGSMLDDDGQPVLPNVIYIRPKMNYAVRKAVEASAVDIALDGTNVIRPEKYLIALLVQNIVRWEGPELSNVPCTPAEIENLDPDTPFLVTVLDEIAARNKKRASPNGSSPTAAGSTNGIARASTPQPASAANQSLQLVTTPSRSPLQKSLDGRLIKSER